MSFTKQISSTIVKEEKNIKANKQINKRSILSQKNINKAK